MNKEEFESIIESVEFAHEPKYEIAIHSFTRENGVVGDDRLYLQGRYLEPDVLTGRLEWQYTRKWYLSPSMTKSEFVQTVFKMLMTSAEHRVREHFRYRGARVYSPHFDVEKLAELARNENNFDERK